MVTLSNYTATPALLRYPITLHIDKINGDGYDENNDNESDNNKDYDYNNSDNYDDNNNNNNENNKCMIVIGELPKLCVKIRPDS